MLNPNRFIFVICGQALTGRLEVLESFFKKRFSEVGIIGLSNIFSSYSAARCTIYKDGRKGFENRLFNFVIERNCALKGLFFLLAYSAYLITGFFCILKFKRIKKELIFIGIGTFPTIIGVLFKSLGLVKKVIYYNIDYFPPTNKAFNVKGVIFLDKICVRKSDLVWSISPKILEAREGFAKISGSQYRHIDVPLCFDESLLRFKPISEVDRWSIVFVGTPGYFHGLELLIEAMPRLIELFPEIKIKIIGPGSWDSMRRQVDNLNLTGYFNFLGFIEEEVELFEIVSRNALGLALYVPVKDNPTLYADPGKPKLYTFCAVPVVISKAPFISEEISAAGAGKAIDFNASSLINAITEIISNDDKWNKFRENAFNFASQYTSKKIFYSAVTESLRILTQS